ncbi:hypothetical protein C8J57DRAFT_1298101 [Mycena rebaudengoi]|nr:hypothetical protein C8J57DRAFT_1298101 [Mycena rebaudengoi]
MFDDDNNHRPSTPLSSPASSPPAYNDSSPASSPGVHESDSATLADADEDPPSASPPLHLFAATAKGSWVPPDYEKGSKKARRTSPSSPSRRSLEPLSLSQRTRVSSITSQQEREDRIFDEAICNAVDNGNGAIDLSDLNLIYIPEKFPAELRNFYREDIQLFLSGNQISELPSGLFYLDKLKLLSLRGNKLTSIPPEIKNLRNLRSLNVAGNRLQFLPAEIMGMTLETLSVSPNPFITEPTPPKTIARHSSTGRIAVAPTARTRTVPSLVELTLRSLFTVDSQPSSIRDGYDERCIGRYYELPLCEDSGLGEVLGSKKEFRQIIPPHLRRILDAAHPGSVFTDKDAPKVAERQTNVGVCPSPRHAHRPSVFVTPIETRYTWERTVAGVNVGGSVPLQWRGCSQGCLDFLDGESDLDADSEAMDVDEEEFTTVLQIPGLAGDDFEEE